MTKRRAKRSPDTEIPIYFQTQRDIAWKGPDPMTHANQLKVEIASLADEELRLSLSEVADEHWSAPTTVG